jgi:hypothetical protein
VVVVAVSHAALSSWEDVRLGATTAGPFVITAAELEDVHRLTGGGLRDGDRVPPLLLQAYASGHNAARSGYSSLIAVRREAYHFHGVLRADEPFNLHTVVRALVAVDAWLGTCELDRQLSTLDGRLIVAGEVSTVMARRALVETRS